MTLGDKGLGGIGHESDRSGGYGGRGCQNPARMPTHIFPPIARAPLFLIIAVISGCAAYNPYINSSQTDADIRECQGPSPAAPALVYACEKRASVETARSELIYTQNAVASAIIPLAGVVGYRVSRGASQAATAGLAATGITAYGLSAYLIQQQRFALYDRAEKAMSCAIGLYKSAAVTSQPPPLELGQYSAAKDQLVRGIRLMSQKFPADAEEPELATILEGFQREVNAGDDAITIVQSSSLLSTQLESATDRILSELDSALTNTVQPITSLSQQESTLEGALKAKQPQSTRAAQTIHLLARILSTPPNSMTAQEGVLLSSIIDAARAYVSARATLIAAMSAGTANTSPDFASCTVGVYVPSTTPTPTPVTVDKTNVTLSNSSGPALVHVSGGRPPYSFDFVPKPAGTAPAYDLETVGSAYILYLTKNSAPASTLHGVLSDTTGSVAEITVTVQ
jgi:hypothetical protein